MWKKENEAGSLSTPATSPRANVAGSTSLASSVTHASPTQSRVPGFDIEATRLTPGIQIKGELSGRSDLYVDGEVQGKIRLSQSMLTIGPNGKVNADVDVREGIVHGVLQGNVQAHERVVLGRTSDVNGDITSQRITIEEGAKFKGRVEMAPAKDSRRSHLEAESHSASQAPALAAAAAEGKDSSK